MSKMTILLLLEFERLVMHLKWNKCPGTDRIAGEMIKVGGSEMIQAIHKIYEQVWQEGTIPQQWTKSIPITIPEERRSNAMQEL